MEYAIITLLTLIILFLLIKVSRLERRLKGLQDTLRQQTHQGKFDENPVEEELYRLIREGKDVKAVKKAREAFGFSLIEGKRYIDQLKADRY
ncbi:hypothetical protein GCM10008986_20150 [Salinibacillus aidingensis]|uniref:Ribosomal protein L7/L12 C-terminal domain-containing protein n=1 Tax=Salinibacillus aidingensis TaxID=237684 RepID=A0ABN1BAL1_9BACI